MTRADGRPTDAAGDAAPPVIRVAAGVIAQDGAYLLARRPAGTHLEGMWEFPGGKCEANETLVGCLTRELREELSIEVADVAPLMTVRHAYPEKTVELHFFRCRVAAGVPQAMPGSELRWVAAADLNDYALPPADRPVIERLQTDDGGSR